MKEVLDIGIKIFIMSNNLLHDIYMWYGLYLCIPLYSSENKVECKLTKTIPSKSHVPNATLSCYVLFPYPIRMS